MSEEFHGFMKQKLEEHVAGGTRTVQCFTQEQLIERRQREYRSGIEAAIGKVREMAAPVYDARSDGYLAAIRDVINELTRMRDAVLDKR